MFLPSILHKSDHFLGSGGDEVIHFNSGLSSQGHETSYEPQDIFTFSGFASVVTPKR